MSNVLPREAKRTVWRMYRARFIIAGSLVALCIAGLSALSMLPSYLALRASEPIQPPSDELLGATRESDRATVLSIQTMLTALSPLIATTTPTEVIARALSSRPSSIIIDHISYSAGTSGTLILFGSATNREAINEYRQTLSTDSFWKTVTVPIGDLTGEPGARFSITLSGDF